MKKLISLLAIMAPFTIIGVSQAQEVAASSEFKAGVHYQVINPAQPTNDNSKIEVVEVFSYICPHCKSFQPYMDKWAEGITEDIDFRRQPVVFGRQQWLPAARAYYTTDAMGVTEKTHNAIFDAIHVQRKNLSSDEQIADFLAELGVDKDDYMKTAASFGIETKIKRGITMTQKYGVRGTPSVVINGKYLTTATMAGTMEKTLEVINYLVEKERSEMLSANHSADTSAVAMATH